MTLIHARNFELNFLSFRADRHHWNQLPASTGISDRLEWNRHRTDLGQNAYRIDWNIRLVSLRFVLAMQRLDIRHQRKPPHSPWCNGRIERFFGTFKAAIRQIQIDSTARLQQAIVEFTFFYNRIRLHQNLNYRTPEMAWLGKTQVPKSKNPRWFAGWDGVLCGWYWDD